MNYSDYRFTLDVQVHQAQVSVPVMLGDTARRLFISLSDGRKPYTIADGCRAVLVAQKPDGTSIFNDCIIENNSTIVYQFTPNTTSAEGIVNCEVRLYGENRLITSAKFIIVVDAKVIRDEEILSESEHTTLDNIIMSERSRVDAENERVAAEALRQQRFDSGEFKGEDGDSPVRGVDYWTEEDVDSLEEILRKKAANIGGFVPVNAPLLDHIIDLNKTTVTVTDVIKNADGTHTVVFNRAKNELTDGGFEQYHSNASIVPLKSFSKGESGWTGLNFGVDGSGIIRFAEVRKASGESHSGDSYLEVWGRYSSLCKSLKLKPFTDYTLSFWVKGPVATAAINNISVLAKAYDGDVLYTSVGGAYWRDIDNSNYERLYNGSFESIPNAVIQNSNVWQECKIDFRTASNEYVDIFIYFGDNSWQYFYFDDFSVIESMGPEFAASYAAGVEVPPEVAVGSVFYIERDGGRAFTRFEYASSYAIKELYKYVEETSRSAYQYAVEGGYTGTEAEFTRRIAMSSTYNVVVPLLWTTNGDDVYQTISLNGIREDDIPVVDVVLGDDYSANVLYLEAWAKIARIETSNNAITLHCYDAPTTAFTIQLKAVI